MPSALSVVMIGRDEATIISRALASIVPVASQIVFVDTGSSDETPDLARRFGAEVVEFQWIDDFSAARNAGLEQARQPWVLALDCDEELVAQDSTAGGINACCREARAPAFVVEIDNSQRNGTVSRHQALRLFRNDPRIRFSNPVHESVADSIYTHWPAQVIPVAPFRLLHHGYASGKNAEKLERNLTIMRLWLEREPLNIYASYKYGVSLQHLGKPDALEWLGRGFELLDRRPDKATFPFGRALGEAYLACLERYGVHSEAQIVRERVKSW